MKIIVCLLVIHTVMNTISAQNYSLKKLWITDTTLAVPESVLFDRQQNILYTSLMHGSSSARDSIGGVAMISTEGRIIDQHWITGLHAPKGMARHGDSLYVADLNELVIISISKRKVIRKIMIGGAKVLNDVTLDEKGIVYISDPRSGNIFKYYKGTASIYLQHLTSPNGLKYDKGLLHFVANGTLYTCDASGNIKIIAEGMDENTDGLEPFGKGFIVTSYTGVIYYVKGNGHIQILLDTRDQMRYSADIGIDAVKSIVYVPGLFNNVITAYEIVSP